MSANNLFKPLNVGKIQVANRIIMAPLTRVRANISNAVPTDIMTTYYQQRASVPGTLLITEATFITERAGGYPGVPGIWSKEQVSAWKNVTRAIHKQKSFVFQQLWALGRVAGPDTLHALGYDLVSASSVPDETKRGQSLAPQDVFGSAPRPLKIEEIKEYVKDYVHAAKTQLKLGLMGLRFIRPTGICCNNFGRAF